MKTIPMKAFLTLRCGHCPNQSFRSIQTAERHMIEVHRQASRCGTGVMAEWVGLPADVYQGGYDLEPHRQDPERSSGSCLPVS